MRGRPARWQGFSLIETVVSVAIAGILLSMGVPSFRKSILDARRTAAVNELLGGVYLARSESLKRSQYITLCPSADGASCATDWSKGWLVYVNTDRRYAGVEPDPAEPVVFHASNDHQGVRIGAGDRAAFTFRPFQINSDNGTLTFCDERGPGAPGEGRAIILNTMGRPRISDRKPDGSALDCR